MHLSRTRRPSVQLSKFDCDRGLNKSSLDCFFMTVVFVTKDLLPKDNEHQREESEYCEKLQMNQ